MSLAASFESENNMIKVAWNLCIFNTFKEESVEPHVTVNDATKIDEGHDILLGTKVWILNYLKHKTVLSFIL